MDAGDGRRETRDKKIHFVVRGRPVVAPTRHAAWRGNRGKSWVLRATNGRPYTVRARGRREHDTFCRLRATGGRPYTPCGMAGEVGESRGFRGRPMVAPTRCVPEGDGEMAPFVVCGRPMVAPTGDGDDGRIGKIGNGAGDAAGGGCPCKSGVGRVRGGIAVFDKKR